MPKTRSTCTKYNEVFLIDFWLWNLITKLTIQKIYKNTKRNYTKKNLYWMIKIIINKKDTENGV